jgi:hypothetical protein
MSRANYTIIDEPRPGTLQRLVVDPMWPLLAVMIAGSLPGFAWLTFNAVAVGSPTRVREIGLCIAGVLGSALLLVALGGVAVATEVPRTAYPYLPLVAVGWKLVCAYAASAQQQGAVELFEYFGGHKRNGLPALLVLAFLVWPAVVAGLRGTPWALLL